MIAPRTVRKGSYFMRCQLSRRYLFWSDARHMRLEGIAVAGKNRVA
jgi:hypothetical protein